MANIVAPVANGESYESVKTKLIAVVENWRGAGFASGGNAPTTWGAMRTLLNGVATLVALPTIGSAESGAGARAKINALNDDTAGGRFTGSSLDLQFANNKAYGAADPLAPLTVTRASAGMVEDLSGSWTSVANNVARRSDKGLLVEEARTNVIRNSIAAGAVVGSPGTAPTNWSIPTSAVTRTIVGVGVQNGIDYVDIRFSGVPNSTGQQSIVPDSLPVANAGETWTNSIFMALVAGSLTNVSSIIIRAGGETGSNTITLDSVFRRYVNVRTLAGANPNLTLRWNYLDTVTAVDFTIRFGLPQCELGAFVTSPIRTSGAAATRAADGETLPSSTVVSAFLEWNEALGATGAERYLFNHVVDANNYIALKIIGDGKLRLQINNAGVPTVITTTNPVAIGNVYKAALRWGANDMALKVTSSLGAPANGSTVTIPAGSFVTRLGSFGASVGFLNSYIRRLVLFPTLQNDAALSAMVA